MMYLGAQPWAPTLASSSEIGVGTSFPVKTGLIATHSMYFNTGHAAIEAQGSARQGSDTGSMNATGSIDRLVDASIKLVIPLGIEIEAEIGSAFFRFLPESKAESFDFLQQYLRIEAGGVIPLISSGISEVPFSSVRTNQDSTQIGYCRVIAPNSDLIEFPLFADIGSTVEASAAMEVILTKFPTV